MQRTLLSKFKLTLAFGGVAFGGLALVAILSQRLGVASALLLALPLTLAELILLRHFVIVAVRPLSKSLHDLSAGADPTYELERAQASHGFKPYRDLVDAISKALEVRRDDIERLVRYQKRLLNLNNKLSIRLVESKTMLTIWRYQSEIQETKTFLSSVLEHLIVGMRFDIGCLFIRPIPKLGPHAVFAKLNKAKPKETESEKPFDLSEEDTQWISELPKSALQYLKTQSAVLETIPHVAEEKARLQLDANAEEIEVAVAALRITQGPRTIGTIHLINKDPNFKLNVYEANFLKNLASQVSVILENRALQYTSQVDSLTQLYNRSFLVSKLQEELVRSSRTSLPLSFLILDVDHFKKINDKFGHQGGDEALITLSSLLKTSARNTDFICRYGGEEIAIILPDTPLAGATIFANTVRAAIESHPFLLNGLEPTQVTVSIGVTSHTPTDPLILEAMIGRADSALYEAKRTGRNRVCVFGEAPVAIAGAGPGV